MLASKGCHVFGSVRKLADAESLLKDLGPASFTPLCFDVTDGPAVSAAAATVATALGPVRCLWGLVNNAGIHAGCDPVAFLEPDVLRRQLEVNLVAPVVVTRAFLPLLGMDRARGGPPGKVVMMSSIYGNYGVPWMVRGGQGERERGPVVVPSSTPLLSPRPVSNGERERSIFSLHPERKKWTSFAPSASPFRALSFLVEESERRGRAGVGGVPFPLSFQPPDTPFNLSPFFHFSTRAPTAPPSSPWKA